MNLPICSHDRENMAPAAGWILTCRPCYEVALTQNLLKYADATLSLKLEKALIDANERIQKLESDIQDMRMMTKQAFIRCAGCDRLTEVSKPCRWCSR